MVSGAAYRYSFQALRGRDGGGSPSRAWVYRGDAARAWRCWRRVLDDRMIADDLGRWPEERLNHTAAPHPEAVGSAGIGIERSGGRTPSGTSPASSVASPRSR